MRDFFHFFKKSAVCKDRPLYCIFYSHIWNVYELEALGLAGSKQDILIELATESQFAVMLDCSHKVNESLLKLLQPKVHLDQLGKNFKNISSPLVLAPNKPVSVNSLLSVLELVASNPGSYEKAVILVNYRDAEKFSDAYALMSGFSILWDVADYPNVSLQKVAEVLVNEHCLDDRQRWQGFYLCNNANRLLPDAIERKEILGNLLNEFPVLDSIAH
jgi:hypothetical protein